MNHVYLMIVIHLITAIHPLPTYFVAFLYFLGLMDGSATDHHHGCVPASSPIYAW